MSLKNYVLIVAAGSGSRMKSLLPKQFMELHGQPILLHTLNRFYSYDPTLTLYVVLHPEFVSYWNDLVRTLQISVPHTIVAGGKERFDSVLNGLNAINDDTGVVAIHDAVRPFVSLRTLESAFSTARVFGSAVPVLPLSDSLREVKESTSSVVDRNNFRLVQTPQCFDLAQLRLAFSQSYQPFFTDDAAVWEASGRNVVLIEGNRENFKITTQEDLRLAEALFLLKH